MSDPSSPAPATGRPSGSRRRAPYTTLGYANGPGAVIPPLAEEGEAEAAAAPQSVAATAQASAVQGQAETTVADVPSENVAETTGGIIERPNPADEDTEAKDCLQQATVPLSSETHAGDDVGVYAAGPFAHLFHGTVGEQYTFHVMRHALGWDRQWA